MQGEHRRRSSAGKGSLFRSTPLHEPLPKRFVRHFMRGASTCRSAPRPGHYRQRLQDIRLQHGLSNGRDTTQPHRSGRSASPRRSLAPIVKGRNGLQCPGVEVPFHIHERQEDNPSDQGQHPAAQHSYAEEVHCARLPAPSGPGSVPRASAAVRFTSQRRAAYAVGHRCAANCSIPVVPSIAQQALGTIGLRATSRAWFGLRGPRARQFHRNGDRIWAVAIAHRRPARARRGARRGAACGSLRKVDADDDGTVRRHRDHRSRCNRTERRLSPRDDFPWKAEIENMDAIALRTEERCTRTKP